MQTSLSAPEIARAAGLPLVQQRTAATLVTLTLSLCVLVLQAVPLTWRRIVLVAAALTGFVPRSGLAIILLIAALGAAALVSLWAALRRPGARPAGAVGER